MDDHPQGCECQDCALQRQFNKRLSAHLRDPRTWACVIGCALPIAAVFALIAGGIFGMLAGRVGGIIVGGVIFPLAAAALCTYFFLSLVINLPFHSGYRLPGSQAVARKDKLAVDSAPRRRYFTCPACKAKSEAWDWDEQRCGKCGFDARETSNPNAVECFAEDYCTARDRFSEASRAAGANVESFENPKCGPQGESLYTDVALIGTKEAKAILVLGSGTHGVEGFAGSAIQTRLLRARVFEQLKPKTSILLIHAINPHGFAHLRRWNEDNVDLNRNFVDHCKPYPENSGYQQLADAIAPESLKCWTDVKSCFRLFWYGLRNGKRSLQQAISGGQYTHPQGIFYGGQCETWSNKTMKVIAERYLRNAQRVVFVDFHTGLGPCGHAEVILNERKGSSAHKRAVAWWGNKVKTTASGESLSVHLQGMVEQAFHRVLPNAEITAVSLEFGTLSPIRVFWALRNENWLYHHGGKNHLDGRRIRTQLLRAFYPNGKDWRGNVLRQGKEVVEQALDQLGEL